MPLFDEQIALEPNNYPWTEDFIVAITDGLWTEREFNFNGDVNQFNTVMTEEERQIIVRTLAAIGQVEIAVKTFWADLGRHFPQPAIRDLGGVMSYTEIIHNRAYVKLLKRLGLKTIFDDFLKTVPVLRDRVQYLKKHNEKVFGDDRKQYIYSIILFTLFIENVSLFSQFYTVLWFNRFKNVLKDTAQQVQYTRNEENLHAQVGIKLINTLREEYPDLFTPDLEAKILQEVQTAYESEVRLINWMVGDYDAPGFNSQVLQTYIKSRLNDSLEAIGFEQVFEVDDDVAKQTLWMQEELLGDNMTDFFHKKPVEYARHAQSFSQEDLF